MNERAEREAFETWARRNRTDLDLRYMYDDRGNYHHHGYIWQETTQAFAIWQARASFMVPDKEELG